MRAGRAPGCEYVRRVFGRAQQENVLDSRESPLREPPVLRGGVSRRELLARAAGGLAALYMGGQAAPCAADTRVRVAVVGAGIAGLNAALLLKRAGADFTVYEASDHIGGRIQTDHNGVAPGISTEMGGEFIDSGHADMRALAHLLELDLLEMPTPRREGLQVAYYAGGDLYSEEELVQAFRPLAARVANDQALLRGPVTYRQHSALAAELDHTNLSVYLRRHETPDWLYKILESAYVNEYGLSLEEQSSLNFVQTVGTDTGAGFQVYGSSDQRYKIRGGNDQLVQRLAQRVASHVRTGHRLEALAQNAQGRYHLTFQTGNGGTYTARADHVILCVPFTLLRDVEMRVSLPASKRRAIRELGYGTNAKLILGFASRVWREDGYNGDSYADLPYQSGWDSSRGQAGTAGAYTLFAGGAAGRNLGHGTGEEQARRLLPGLDTVFGGAQEAWNGRVRRAYWPGNPFVKASYAAYKPGQWTGLRGLEGAPVGNLYFAGEHTSLEWQGYMNGGAESGRVAAQTLLHRLSH